MHDLSYFARKLQEGQEYEDYMAMQLWRIGFPLIGFGSKRYQFEHGENLLGMEIKRDGEFRNTRNLYIEVAEKRDARNREFVPSGIMRDDNSWLFLIGDEETAYIFPTAYLQWFVRKKGWPEHKGDTSRGYLMPIADAEKYCIKRLDMQP